MKKSLVYLARAAVIAALYCALSVAFNAIAFGPVQFRVSEILVLLPLIFPEAIPGLAIGCFFTNFFFSPFGVFDMVLGTLATLIGAVGTVAGAQLLVDNGSALASMCGVSNG